MNNAAPRPRPVPWLPLILLLAAAIRLYGIGFGLPALYDPDELIFQLMAVKLIGTPTLNPEWFGHPATTTIYALALVDLGVFGAALATGRARDPATFLQVLYADPGVLMRPGRVLMVVFAIASIWATYRLAARLFDRATGLFAAALLAIDPIHVAFSQITRPDIQSGLFLLLLALAAVDITERGARSNYVRAGAWLGAAVATKWPAAAGCLGIFGAAVLRIRRVPAQRRSQLRRLTLAAAVSVGVLLLISPFLLFDYPLVIRDLTGETRPHHLGATGFGLFGNLLWYVRHPLLDALGPLGLVLAVVGAVIGVRRNPAFGAVVLPIAGAMTVLLAMQHLVWERWALPLLPFVSIAAALGLRAALGWLRRALPAGWRGAATAALLAALATPLVLGTVATARERQDDTRARASAWMRGHLPPRATILIEHWAFDLLSTRWGILFPLGDAGCLDVRPTLAGRMTYATVQSLRGTKALVDIGSLNPARLDTCRADYAIFVDYDRYRAEAARFPAELALYEELIRRGRIVATFRPDPGRAGGPVVRVVKLGIMPPGRADPSP